MQSQIPSQPIIINLMMSRYTNARAIQVKNEDITDRRLQAVLETITLPEWQTCQWNLVQLLKRQALR